MPIEHLLLGDQQNIQAGFDHAVRIAMHEAYAQSVGSLPQEPDIVAMLVLEGTPYLAGTLRAVLNPHGLYCTVSSVFCHQRPEVKLDTGARCELGDLLLVHRHYDSNQGQTRSNALLLQAKRCGANGHTVTSEEHPQLDLYQRWPGFTYVRSGPELNGMSRNVMPKQRHGGAQYLLIDDGAQGPMMSGMLGWPETHCMSIWPATSPLVPVFPFSEELFDMVLGRTGRPFEDDISQDPSGWSQVVWDLLGHSLRYAFNRKQVGLHRRLRAGGDSLASPIEYLSLCVSGNDIGVDNRSSRSPLHSILHRTVGKQRRGDGEPPPIDLPTDDTPTDEIPTMPLVLIETGRMD